MTRSSWILVSRASSDRQFVGDLEQCLRHAGLLGPQRLAHYLTAGPDRYRGRWHCQAYIRALLHLMPSAAPEGYAYFSDASGSYFVPVEDLPALGLDRAGICA